MKINPYEAPQTTNLPLARQAPPLEPHIALQQGARRCTRGGRLLMSAAISEFLGIGVLLWIQQAKQHGPTNLLNLCGWILLTGSWVLLLAGAILNLLGYSRFIRHLDHEILVKLFRDCRRVVWVKIALTIAAIACADLLDFDKRHLVTIVVCSMLLGMVLHSYLAHARAMKIWGEHFPDPAASFARRVYFWSGLTGTLLAFGLVTIFLQDTKEPSRFLLMGVMLSYALSFAAFANFYGRLRIALEHCASVESNADASL